MGKSSQGWKILRSIGAHGVGVLPVEVAGSRLVDAATFLPLVDEHHYSAMRQGQSVTVSLFSSKQLETAGTDILSQAARKATENASSRSHPPLRDRNMLSKKPPPPPRQNKNKNLKSLRPHWMSLRTRVRRTPSERLSNKGPLKLAIPRMSDHRQSLAPSAPSLSAKSRGNDSSLRRRQPARIRRALHPRTHQAQNPGHRHQLRLSIPLSSRCHLHQPLRPSMNRTELRAHDGRTDHPRCRSISNFNVTI